MIFTVEAINPQTKDSFIAKLNISHFKQGICHKFLVEIIETSKPAIFKGTTSGFYSDFIPVSNVDNISETSFIIGTGEIVRQKTYKFYFNLIEQPFLRYFFSFPFDKSNVLQMVKNGEIEEKLIFIS